MDWGNNLVMDLGNNLWFLSSLNALSSQLMLQVQPLPWASLALDLHFHYASITFSIIPEWFKCAFSYQNINTLSQKLRPKQGFECKQFILELVLYGGMGGVKRKGRVCVKERVDALRNWDSVLWKSVRLFVCSCLGASSWVICMLSSLPHLVEGDTQVHLTPWPSPPGPCSLRQARGGTQWQNHTVCLGNVHARKCVCPGNVCR